MIGSPPEPPRRDYALDEVAMTLSPDPSMWVVVRTYHDGSGQPLAVYGVCASEAEAQDLAARIGSLDVPDRLTVVGVHRADRTEMAP